MQQTRILIVDDEQIIANVLGRILSEKYTVSTCYNGIEALKILRNAESPFHIVFLDYLMPELNGKAVLEWIKENSPKTKVVLMTAYGDEAVRNELTVAGADLILNKPFDDINVVFEVVENFKLS